MIEDGQDNDRPRMDHHVTMKVLLALGSINPVFNSESRCRKQVLVGHGSVFSWLRSSLKSPVVKIIRP